MPPTTPPAGSCSFVPHIPYECWRHNCLAINHRFSTEPVARLSDLLLPAAEPGRDDWKSVVGMFANDSIMKEIDEETRKIREADRARARKKWKTDK
jgi:hypothetical protein